MSQRKPLTDEMLRILRAANVGALYINSAGRWQVGGDAPPDRKSRERLIKSGYLRPSWQVRQGEGLLTALGVETLREAGER